MKNKEYQYTESPFNVSRRQFITIGGIVVALLSLPVVWVKYLATSRNDYILARTKGLYRDDEKAKIRVSHANPAVAQYYRDFGGKPLGGMSEELLHTKYINRTKGLS
ncbi:MAG: iron hydrogenase small subunit [Syntrophales bacterium]|jgi:ferredoxin hydrogenase small subunit|nr:iron hydrogenase small subunit [Syntrophales bacterium]